MAVITTYLSILIVNVTLDIHSTPPSKDTVWKTELKRGQEGDRGEK
jgi:hypothetical protein